MRLHRNLVFTVIDALNDIYNEGLYADKVVQASLKRDKRWGARDRKFVAETIYDMVRWKRLYNEIAGTKDHYTRENIWKNFAVWAVLNGIELPDWPQLGEVPERRIRGGLDKFKNDRKIYESIPDWLDEMGVRELGEKKWATELKSLNEQAQVVLRTNTLKIDRDSLQKVLENEEIITKALKNHPDALVLNERQNVFKSEAFKKGYFEVQDASSQLVAPYLEVKPGMRVVDTCAGAGGKTLHLAAQMENKGQLIAMDIYAGKLAQLKKRAKRAGVHNVNMRVIEGTKTIKKLKNSADRVLIDAPCSGIGVLKRNPDSKWKLQEEFVENIKQTQAQILSSYSSMLKVNGLLVYATCSIMPSENEEQVEKFLAEHKNFKLHHDLKVSPSESGFDGFYMALLERTE
ncbi:RsmB/NOP family class I SAM-dependent RNA methyltransferase [Flavobacteriaceae bacterium]|nr:RsmB/NOP family class I SAM-dependent RNA methyltransferase [Flavobacteriaceae bacterium]